MVSQTLYQPVVGLANEPKIVALLNKQIFGAAMFLPLLLFSLAVIVVALGCLITNAGKREKQDRYKHCSTESL
jgi:hypothetical protein